MTDTLAVIPKAPSYEQVRRLEAIVARMPQVELDYRHHFADGVYVREMRAKAGDLLVGKIHRMSTVNILAAGSIQATSEDGSVRVLEAPAVFVSPPGCKKVGLALTDVVWINVHATRLTDLAAIEQKFIVPEAPALTDEDQVCLGSQ